MGDCAFAVCYLKLRTKNNYLLFGWCLVVCVYMQAVANMPTNIHPSFSKLIEKAECIEIVSFSHITASTFNILHTIILYFFFVRIIHNIYNNYLFSIANEFQERKIQITVFFSFFLLSHKTKYETIHNIFSD